MDKDRINRYIERIEGNMTDIKGLTDRVDIISITDIVKENLKCIKREVER